MSLKALLWHFRAALGVGVVLLLIAACDPVERNPSIHYEVSVSLEVDGERVDMVGQLGCHRRRRSPFFFDISGAGHGGLTQYISGMAKILPDGSALIVRPIAPDERGYPGFCINQAKDEETGKLKWTVSPRALTATPQIHWLDDPVSPTRVEHVTSGEYFTRNPNPRFRVLSYTARPGKFGKIVDPREVVPFIEEVMEYRTSRLAHWRSYVVQRAPRTFWSRYPLLKEYLEGLEEPTANIPLMQYARPDAPEDARIFSEFQALPYRSLALETEPELRYQLTDDVPIGLIVSQPVPLKIAQLKPWEIPLFDGERLVFDAPEAHSNWSYDPVREELIRNAGGRGAFSGMPNIVVSRR